MNRLRIRAVECQRYTFNPLLLKYHGSIFGPEPHLIRAQTLTKTHIFTFTLITQSILSKCCADRELPKVCITATRRRVCAPKIFISVLP